MLLFLVFNCFKICVLLDNLEIAYSCGCGGDFIHYIKNLTSLFEKQSFFAVLAYYFLCKLQSAN